MKFVVDGMLGSFTRWLRLLGYEADYFKDASDDFLIERTTIKGATLLTKDVDLFRRARVQGLQAFLVEGDDEAERLASVAVQFNLRLEVDDVLSKCPTCGSSLKRVDAEEVRSKIPEGSLRHFQEFWICTGCSKVYWRGRHWKKINETLAKARELLHEH